MEAHVPFSRLGIPPLKNHDVWIVGFAEKFQAARVPLSHLQKRRPLFRMSCDVLQAKIVEIVGMRCRLIKIA
jgi:hypothetical protein